MQGQVTKKILALSEKKFLQTENSWKIKYFKNERTASFSAGSRLYQSKLEKQVLASLDSKQFAPSCRHEWMASCHKISCCLIFAEDGRYIVKSVKSQRILFYSSENTFQKPKWCVLNDYFVLFISFNLKWTSLQSF